MHIETFSATEGPLSDYDLDEEEKLDFPNTGVLGLVANEYAFEYDYPLTTPATFYHNLTPETTALDILAFGAQDYKNIYEIENAGTKIKPGFIPGMLNRNKTNGTYGIWGHGLGDLCFTGININIDEQTVSFDIDS